MHPRNRAVRVKEVIDVLCKLLRAIGLHSVPTPELFRRAKFNGGPEVEDPFWQLLASVLKTSNIISVEAFPKIPGVSDCRRLVAQGLWQRGYHMDWITCVGAGGEPGEASWGPCSRELLLALGWLLSTGTLETLLAHRAQQLDTTQLDLAGIRTTVTPPTVHGAQLDRPSLRKLQWLIGSMRLQRRSLLSMQEERSKLMHKVLSAGSSPSFSSSTFVSNHNSALQQDCVCMQELCNLLEAYVNWKRSEKFFWVWMDSVVDCHVRDQRGACPVDPDVPVSANRSRGLESLSNMLAQLPAVQETRGQRREMEEPRCTRGTERGQREDKLLARDDSRTLSEMVQTSPPWIPSLSLHMSPSPVPWAYRLKLQGETQMPHSRRPAEQTSDGPAPAGTLQAWQASRVLLQMEALLLERRDRSRQANRLQLQEMIGRLEGLVLIAP